MKNLLFSIFGLSLLFITQAQAFEDDVTLYSDPDMTALALYEQNAPMQSQGVYSRAAREFAPGQNAQRAREFAPGHLRRRINAQSSREFAPGRVKRSRNVDVRTERDFARRAR
jgi:hypothetical protein